MSRSGYIDDANDFANQAELYRANVRRALSGKRGQRFLRELRAALDALPKRELIAGHLVAHGQCCALGAVAIARGVDVSDLDSEMCPEFDEYPDPAEVASALSVCQMVAAEIMYVNDERGTSGETPDARWRRVSAWVDRWLAGAPTIND